MQKLRMDLDIGQNIRALRKSCNMTQDNVVARMQLLGVPITRSTYAKLETNLMNIKISELIALKMIFGCRYEDFFAGLEI